MTTPTPESTDDPASKWWNNYELKIRDDVKEMVAYHEEAARVNAEDELSSRVIDRMKSVGAIVGGVVGIGLYVLLSYILIVQDPEIPFLLGAALFFGGFVGLPLGGGLVGRWLGDWCGRRLLHPTEHR